MFLFKISSVPYLYKAVRANICFNYFDSCINFSKQFSFCKKTSFVLLRVRCLLILIISALRSDFFDFFKYATGHFSKLFFRRERCL